MADNELSDEDLQTVYCWVDSIQLSRPKRNISRDFADGGKATFFFSFNHNTIYITENQKTTNKTTNSTQQFNQTRWCCNFIQQTNHNLSNQYQKQHSLPKKNIKTQHETQSNLFFLFLFLLLSPTKKHISTCCGSSPFLPSSNSRITQLLCCQLSHTKTIQLENFKR
jgi:hypothetical protein